MRSWWIWLEQQWPRLTAGDSLEVPAWLPHPATAGFSLTQMAEPAGQCMDWVASATDGSRVHVHDLCDGRMVVHRDPTDPARGPLHAAWHWLFESNSGRFTLIAGGAMAAIWLFTRGNRA